MTVNITNNDNSAFALAEYSALRDEILKRIEFQNNTLNWALVIAGSVVTFGLQLNNPMILLLYPPIALGLSASWEQNNLRIRQLGAYIRKRIESRFPNNGWEQYRIDESVKVTGTAKFARETFRYSQIAMLVLSIILLYTSLPKGIVLLVIMGLLIVIDCIAIGLTDRRIKTLELE
jgi:hypothetical protein